MRITLPKSLYKKIEEDVVNLYLEFELSVPLDPGVVAAKLGYIVKRFSEVVGENEEMLALLCGDDKSQRDGLSYFDPNLYCQVILVNDIKHQNEERMNFTIMHEIGHIRMGHKSDSLLAEMIANYYAAYALVPSPLYSLFKCENFIDIMNDFEVSELCAWNCVDRCENWKCFGHARKQYEKDFVSYYTEKLERGECL